VRTTSSDVGNSVRIADAETMMSDVACNVHAEPRSDPDVAGESMRRLLDIVQKHARAEVDSLNAYVRLATTADDPVVALVMRLILEDEERHHGLLEGIASTLQEALVWRPPAGSLPSGVLPSTPAPADLERIARGLVNEETDGAQLLHELAWRDKGINGGLDSLLLEMMALDSQKHALMLRFVCRRLAARPTQQTEGEPDASSTLVHRPE
jgi:hypothetical protein